MWVPLISVAVLFNETYRSILKGGGGVFTQKYVYFLYKKKS